MESKASIGVLAVVTVALALALGGKAGPKPAPPTPPGPQANIQAQARESMRSYALRLATNVKEAADKQRDGDFKDAKAAHAWLLPKNEQDRKEAFRDFNLMLDDASEQGHLEKALRDASAGFVEFSK